MFDEHVLMGVTLFAPPFMPLAYKNKLNWTCVQKNYLWP